MTELLSFPFRISRQGVAVTHDDMSEQYCAERLSIIVGTRPGERVMVPTFGVNDPAFEGFTAQALMIQATQYGLPVDIQRVRRSILNDAQEHVEVQFTMSQSIRRSVT